MRPLLPDQPILMDISRLRALTSFYALEELGLAMTAFAEVSVVEGRIPEAADADLLATYPEFEQFPKSRACFLDIVAAVAPDQDCPDQNYGALL